MYQLIMSFISLLFLPLRYLIKLCVFLLFSLLSFQNLKNQIMTTNLWVEQVTINIHIQLFCVRPPLSTLCLLLLLHIQNMHNPVLIRNRIMFQLNKVLPPPLFVFGGLIALLLWPHKICEFKYSAVQCIMAVIITTIGNCANIRTHDSSLCAGG